MLPYIIQTRTGHRDGLGLGLSIVQAIATAHGATLTTRAQPEGGLAITVRFPAVDARANDPAASTNNRELSLPIGGGIHAEALEQSPTRHPPEPSDHPLRRRVAADRA